jgi:RecA-family ATPase
MREYSQEEIDAEARVAEAEEYEKSYRKAGTVSAEIINLAERVKDRDRQAFTSKCAYDFEGVPVPDREWLVEGAIPHENVTLLSGDGGLGKTILALMLGVALSTKTEWFGFTTMQGPFLYVGAEDDDSEVHRRLDQMRCEMGLQWSDFCDFHFRSLVGEDAVMATYDRGQQRLKATQLLLELEQHISDLGVVACVLDTSADMFGGDEIDRKQVRQFISLLRGVCRRQHCAIMLLSHPSVAGMASGTGISGSTAWNNSVRSRLYLEADNKDTDARTLKFMKSNYGPKGEPMALRYQRGQFVLDEVRAGSTPEQADAMFLATLDKYTAQDRDVSPNVSSTYAPKVFADDETCGGLSKKAFKAAMDRLLASKAIKVEPFGPPSKLRKRIVRA